MGIGKRIRIKRKNLGLKQTELSEQTGISVQSIQNYEAGKSHPKGDYLEKLARSLKCGMDWLQTGQGPVVGAGPMEYAATEREEGGWALRQSVSKLTAVIENQAEELERRERETKALRAMLDSKHGEGWSVTSIHMESEPENVPIENHINMLRAVWKELNEKERNYMEVKLKALERDLTKELPLFDQILNKSGNLNESGDAPRQDG